MNFRKIYIPILLLYILTGSCKGISEISSPETFAVTAEGSYIIPKPSEIKWGNAFYSLPPVNIICFNSEAEESSEWLKQLLTRSNLNVQTVQGNSCGNWNISLDASLKSELGEEGYTLNIDEKGIFLKAATKAGLFYAVQTLRQLLPASIENGEFRANDVRFSHVNITDIPDYSWRGTMVDVARSFFGLDYLKAHVDRMAFYKMNRLHLHLTDDQGWRIEIKSKPELTIKGSTSSVVDGRSGYLSQDEYKDLQAYAAARNIIVIPEIDMPGHIYSALVAYPELNCEGYSNIEPRMATPPEMFTGTKVGWSKLCLTKPEIYDFVSDVIGEMAGITTGPWIHIGGDEIKDDLYETFVVKADSIVKTFGKTTIGWEEVTKAPVSSSLISQQWHGKVKSVVDVKVIESICTSFYFDHSNIPGQEKTNNWCKKTGVTLEEVYNFSSDNNNVLGFEAPVWTEFVFSDESLDNRFWPRTIAVAEIAWNHDPSRTYSEFSGRLKGHEERLKRMGVNYFPVPDLNFTENTNQRISDVFKGFIPKTFKGLNL